MSRFSPPIDRDISLNFPPIWQVLSLQISVHRNFPTYLSNYFGHLKSLFSCKYHYLWVMCKFWKKMIVFTRIRTYSSVWEYPVLPTRPLQHKKYLQLQKLGILQKFGKFAEPNRKWKISIYIPKYFRGQKGMQEKYLYMVVKIKLVYWLDKNYGH